MRSLGRPLAFFLLLLSAMTCLLHAQTGTSFTLEGTVYDPAGAVIGGATVTVTNAELGVSRTATTNREGRYVFAALPPTGHYDVSVAAAGFATNTEKSLAFQANTSPVVDITMSTGVVENRVDVSAASQQLETSTSEVDTTIPSQSIQNLPSNGRNFFDYIMLTPGAVRNGTGSGAVTLNGQGIRELTILADGVPNQLREIRTDAGDLAGGNGTFSLDVVQEINVVTNGYSAEFGRSMAGVVNVITRSGTNQVHGDGFYFDRAAALGAHDPLTHNNPNLNREQWGGTIGGPIIKDRLLYLGNYEQTHQQQNASGITSPLQTNPGQLLQIPFRELKFFGKADYKINDANRFEGRYSIIRSRADNQDIGGLSTTQRADSVSDHTQDVEVSDTSVFSARLVNEARFAYTRDVYLDYQASVGPALPPDFSKVGAAANYAGVGNLGPDPNIPQDLNENGYTGQDKLSQSIGNHELKYGGEYSKYVRFVTFYDNFTGTYTFAAGTPYPFNINNPKTYPTQYTQAFGISGLNYNESLYGAFVQDDFKASRFLTINAGLRYDYETIMHDSNNFSPRIGFAWDIFKTGQTILRGNYGIFYATIETSLINRESNNGPNGIKTISIVPGDPLFPTYPNRIAALPPNANVTLSDVFIPIVRGLSTVDFPDSVGNKYGGLRVNPYTEQATLQVQQEMPHEIVLSIDYVNLHGVKLLRTEDMNLPPYFEIGPGRTRTQAQADAERPWGVPSRVPGPLGITFGGYRRLLIQDSGDQSFYNALNVRFKKRVGSRATFEGFYTWSKAISDSDNFRENTALHVDPANYLIDRGLSDQDRRNNFLVNGFVQLPYGFRLGGILSAISGLRYSGAAGSDAMGIATTRDERPLNGRRNAFGTPAAYNLDANLAKTIHIKNEQSLDLRAETFNTLNHFNFATVNNVIGLNPAAPPATFGKATSAASGRTVQFGAKYSF
jgi:outer membrane receptor for ferrienterochelin and colicin